MILAYQAADMREGAMPTDYRSSVTDRVTEIHAPALVIVGENDEPDFRVIADLLAANLPDAHLEVFPDCWHMTPMEQPEEFNAQLIGFLRTANAV